MRTPRQSGTQRHLDRDALRDWCRPGPHVSTRELGPGTELSKSGVCACFRTLYTSPSLASVSGHGLRMVRHAWTDRNPIASQSPANTLLLWCGYLAWCVDDTDT